MPATPLIPGQSMPDITLSLTDGGSVRLNAPGWRLLVVFRGAHCAMCRAFLGQAEQHRAGFEAAGIELLLASADPDERSSKFLAETGYGGKVAAGLTRDQMDQLHLYVTEPGKTGATQAFAEPAAFAIDPQGRLHLVQIGNAPYARPDLPALLAGLTYDRDNGVAARGGAQ